MKLHNHRDQAIRDRTVPCPRCDELLVAVTEIKRLREAGWRMPWTTVESGDGASHDAFQVGVLFSAARHALPYLHDNGTAESKIALLSLEAALRPFEEGVSTDE